VLFAVMGVIWGIPYLLIRVAVREISPATLVIFRTTLGGLLLLPLAAFRGELRPVLRRWRPVLAFGLAEVAIPWIMLSTAEQKLSSSLSGLLIAAVPLVGAVIARTTRHERMRPEAVAGLVLGLVGVAAIVGLDLGTARLWPLLEIAVVVLGYAAGPAILSRYLSDLPARGVIAASLAIGAIVNAPLAALSFPAHLPPAKALAAVAVLGVVCTAVAFLLFFALIAEIGPVRATVITYVNPAVAAILGVAVLNERFTAGMAIGFALVLSGSFLATRPARAREERMVELGPEAVRAPADA
jgi:drug/metabolite transporter (DMT)-like permease